MCVRSPPHITPRARGFVTHGPLSTDFFWLQGDRSLPFVFAPQDAALSWVRKQVSGPNIRYRDGTMDIDLTYVTDRIIAMSFPAEGLESAFRNSADQVRLLTR